MAMAGLIQDQTKQAINGLPGLSQLPSSGRCSAAATPTTRPTHGAGDALYRPGGRAKDLSRPDDGFASASDPQSDLLGSINRIYGVPGRTDPAPRTIAAPMALSRTEAGQGRNHDSHITRRMQSRPPYRGSACGLAVALGACTHTDEVATR